VEEESLRLFRKGPDMSVYDIDGDRGATGAVCNKKKGVGKYQLLES